MLIQAKATFEASIDEKRSLTIEKGEYADLPGAIALQAIHQGAARAAELAEIQSPPDKPERSARKGKPAASATNSGGAADASGE